MEWAIDLQTDFVNMARPWQGLGYCDAQVFVKEEEQFVMESLTWSVVIDLLFTKEKRITEYLKVFGMFFQLHSNRLPSLGSLATASFVNDRSYDSASLVSWKFMSAVTGWLP